jgi:very-short-patch-repair endonuclease
LSVGWPSALSHTSALRRWGLAVRDTPQRHVLVPAHRHLTAQPQLRLHRVQRVPPLVKLGEVVTVDRPDAIVQGWECLDGTSRRGPLLSAVRKRQVTVDQLRSVLSRRSRVTDRTALCVLIDALADGCESELELWGYLHVFDVRGLRHARRQLVLSVRGERFRLDLAYEDEMLAVELDGRAYHSAPDQWERDIRRDAVLATIGWQTLRFSHRRLTQDVPGCRRQTLQILAARRRWRDSS